MARKLRLSNDASNALFALAESLTGADEEFPDAIEQLLRLGRKAAPHPVWRELMEEDFLHDGEQITDWANESLADAPERNEGIILEARITRVCEETGEALPPEEWFCALNLLDFDHECLSDNPPLVPAALNTLYHRLAEEAGPGGELDVAEYLCLLYTGLAAAHIARSLEVEILLGESEEQRVGVSLEGWGEDYALGMITEEGWEPATTWEGL